MKTLGAAGLVVLPVACCAVLPLVLAVASGAALAVWGAVAFAVVLASAGALVGLRTFCRRAALPSSLEGSADDRCC